MQDKNLQITHWLTRSFGSMGFLLLRVWLGLAMMIHGYESVVGGGMNDFVEYLKEYGTPAPLFMAWLAKGSEFFGGLLLIVGLFSKISALLIFITMAVATFLVHKGVIVGSAGELTWCYLLISLAIVIQGPGRISFDYIIANRKQQEK